MSLSDGNLQLACKPRAADLALVNQPAAHAADAEVARLNTRDPPIALSLLRNIVPDQPTGCVQFAEAGVCAAIDNLGRAGLFL